MFYLLITPFWLATGFFPRRLLAIKPTYSYRAANLAYVVLACLRHMTWPLTFDLQTVRTFAGIMVIWMMVTMFASPRWQVAILFAWAATDVISLATGYDTNTWDWCIFIIYCLRSFVDKES
jgi:hypothetical protein